MNGCVCVYVYVCVWGGWVGGCMGVVMCLISHQLTVQQVDQSQHSAHVPPIKHRVQITSEQYTLVPVEVRVQLLEGGHYLEIGREEETLCTLLRCVDDDLSTMTVRMWSMHGINMPPW